VIISVKRRTTRPAGLFICKKEEINYYLLPLLFPKSSLAFQKNKHFMVITSVRRRTRPAVLLHIKKKR